MEVGCLKIKQKNRKKKLSLKEITEGIGVHYKKVKRAFSDNQSQLQEFQTIQVVFLYALQWCKFC